MEYIIMVLQFGLPLGLIVLALITGGVIEQNHFRDIAKRESATSHQPVVTSRKWDETCYVEQAALVQGSVVVSIDYFKRFMGSLYNLVGGRVRSFESVLDRARREALLRMKESCPGADIFINLRLETSMLANTTSKGQYLGGIEVIAYSTAVRYRRENANEIRTATSG